MGKNKKNDSRPPKLTNEALKQLRTLNESSTLENFETFIDNLISNPKHNISPQHVLEALLAVNPEQIPQGMEGKLRLANFCLSRGAEIKNEITVYHKTGHAYLVLSCKNCQNGNIAFVGVGMYPKLYPSAEKDLIAYNLALANAAGLGTIVSLNPSWITSAIAYPLVTSSIHGVLKDRELDQNKGREPYILYKLGAAISGLNSREPNSGRYEIRKESACGIYPKTLQYGAEPHSVPDAFEDCFERQTVASKKYTLTEQEAHKVYSYIEDASLGNIKGLEYRLIGSNCADFVDKTLNAATGLPSNHLYEFYGNNMYPGTRIQAYHLSKSLSNIFLAPYYGIKSVSQQMATISEYSTFQPHHDQNYNMSYINNSPTQKNNNIKTQSDMNYRDLAATAALIMVIGNMMAYSIKTAKNILSPKKKGVFLNSHNK